MRAALLIFLLSLPSCVLKSRHEDVVAKKMATETEVTTLRQTQLKLETDNQRLTRDNANLATRNTELSRTNELLSSRNTELVDRCLQVEKELLRMKEEKAQAEEKVAFVTETYDDLVNTLKDEIEAGQVAIAEQGDRLTVNVADQVLFASGSDEIQSAGKKVLKKVAPILRKTKDKRVLVEGHTDNVPIRGPLQKTFPTNWELSTARATKVVRFLQEQKVPGSRLGAVGYGEHRPVTSNKSARGRKKNRRIEIVLLPLLPKKK